MLSVLGVAVALAVCEAAAVLTSTAGLCTRHWRPNRRPKKLGGGDLGLPPPRPNGNNTVKTTPVKTIPVEIIPVMGSKKVFGEIGGGASGGGGVGKGGNAGGGGGGGGEKPACHGGDHGYHGGDYGHGHGGGCYGHGYGGGGWGDIGGDGGGGGWD